MNAIQKLNCVNEAVKTLDFSCLHLSETICNHKTNTLLVSPFSSIMLCTKISKLITIYDMIGCLYNSLAFFPLG